MDQIILAVENIVLAIITGIRDLVAPFFQKYANYYKYIDLIFYGTYAIILFGFYNAIPEYIPVLRNTILYIAVFILLIRFNKVSWTNPKFAVLGGNKFSEFDRRLIISTCIFILFSHIVSEAVANYTKDQISRNITRPISTNVVHPIYNYIDTSGAVDNIPAVKKFLRDQQQATPAQ
jgi:c-di-AMP phosphodiesterase-like protein